MNVIISFETLFPISIVCKCSIGVHGFIWILDNPHYFATSF